ncbi:MAG TPA: 3-oxoadipate enol-lactonase [Candidatus Angelobacter sp.]
MPFLNVNNTRLFYRLEGRDDLPTLALSHSLGCDHAMWDPQMPDLLAHFRVLRYDTRGHGASAAPAGDYSIEQLGGDLLGLADALKIEKFAFCGLSMGGAVGQWLALHAPQRLTALVLANTSPKFGTDETWNDRRKQVKEGGMAAVAETVLERFFSAHRRTGPYEQSVRRVLLGTDPAGYVACCAALRDVNCKNDLVRISLPTLVIGSDADPSTPWEANGEILARNIAGAKSVVLRGAHLSNLEQPRAFTTALLEFLLDHSEGTRDPLDAGLKVRRQVLGSAHVDRSMSSANELNRDFQNLITRYAWGAVWSRPGLDQRTRTLLVLAMMPALGRWEEFRLHLGAALARGMEPCDVKEVLLQVAIYAGVPAANTAFQIFREEVEKNSASTKENP